MKNNVICIGVLTLFVFLSACANQDSLLYRVKQERQVIHGISASESGITISGNRPFVYLVRREYQDSLPPVLVIKLKETGLGRFRQPMMVSGGPVEEIVPYKTDEKGKWNSEIHLRLRKYTEYEIKAKGNSLTISFEGYSESKPARIKFRDEELQRESPELKILPKTDGVVIHPGGYVIGPEDVLEILVWKNEDLSRIVTVRPDGNISLPLIGEVQSAGLTPKALRDNIVEMVSEYQIVPGVSVIVKEVNSYNIYILGEVASPGKYQLKSNATLLQAISLAGGFTPFASRNDIKILRKEPRAGKEKILKVRYKDIVSNEDPGKNLLLIPGDTIIVP